MLYHEAAARWWSEKIRGASLDDFDNEEPSAVGLDVMFQATEAAMLAQPEGDELDSFENDLSDAVRKEVESHGFVTLDTDYAPKGTLYDIARESGISMSVFPWKTHMYVTKDLVTVRDGRSAPVETIFTTK